MLKLKEGFASRDNNKIISSLMKLRQSSISGQIDRETFEVLIELIKAPNAKTLNYALSILANCCMNKNYRRMFKEFGGFPHLILIVKTIENDSIICRACRLIGNLALNNKLAEELCENNVGFSLLQILEKHENLSSGTITMIFRAVKKLWTVKEFKWKMPPDDLMLVFNRYLSSEDEQVIKVAIEFIILFSRHMNVQKNKNLKINKELFLKLLELSKNENLNHLVISCLSNLICYQTSLIWCFLEGSKIAEVFIKYFQETDTIDENIYRAFCKLCTEVTIRSKVRLSGLLPRLIDISNSSNVKNTLAIFYLFQYELVSLMVCSQNPKFVTILIDNILLPGSIQLLAVLSRFNPPSKELILNKNLDVIIKNKECLGILKNITRTREFLKPIILSGKVWQIEKAGCSLQDVSTPEQIECLLIQLLSSNEKKCREEVSLAVPFLVRPRNFELLYKMLAHYQVMTTILNLLQKSPTEGKVLATIVRLINIFRHNYDEPASFFQCFVKGEPFSMGKDPEDEWNDGGKDGEGDDRKTWGSSEETDSDVAERVTFELDNGDSVSVNKNLLCNNSPVLNSMLNGHFIEARQEKIKLRKCTKECLLHLVSLLSGKATLSDIKTEVYLELLSVTDRFLLISLNSDLTRNLKMDENCCSSVYNWYRTAGFTVNNAVIGQKIYEFIFRSSENLLSAMKNDSCKNSLVNEISQYLSSSLRDLL